MELTRQELADAAGLSYRQLYNINKKLSEADPDKALFVEVGDSKKCDLTVFIQRWTDYKVSQAIPEGGDLDLNLVRARHETVKMRKTELEVDRLRGMLVSVKDVRRLWGDIANTIMQAMLHLPQTVAPMVRGLKKVDVIQGILDAEIRKTLELLSETPLPDYLLDFDDEGEDEDQGES